MNHSSISPKERAIQRAKKLNIQKNVLGDAFRILDTIQNVSEEMRGEWPDIGQVLTRDDAWKGDREDDVLTIPGKFRGRNRAVPTGVPVNVIPTNKTNQKGRCCAILFVHINDKKNSTKQQEIITEAGQHVSDICPKTQIIIIHGTMDYYVWNKKR